MTMNQVSEKELAFLNDALGEEELLVKKFKMLANHAQDKEIKEKFMTISAKHQEHFDALYRQLG
jgi:rubrerythrin